MRSKTMLAGLSVFRCDNKKSLHGQPSWESERTKEFAAWSIGMCQGNAVSMSNLESAEWFVSRHGSTKFFVFGQSKINSHANRQPNSMGSSQERLHRKEE